MRTLEGKAGAFLALHRPGDPLLQPNAWDAGSARILADLGFAAVATTSSGFAATLGLLDGMVPAALALGHCRQVAAAVTIPVAADLEDGFAIRPEAVAGTVRAATRTGLAGCSVEDFTRDPAHPIYELGLATERVAAAAEAAHTGNRQLVLTARAENHVHGQHDLADTIRRLQAYQEAGADVLFAPGVHRLDDVRSVVTSVDLPVNVLALPGCPTVTELAGAGVARISVGGGFAYAALGALIDAATALRDDGTFGFWEAAMAARPTIRRAFGAVD